MDTDARLDAREARRLAADARRLDRLDRREAEASKMIGELASGKCYVWPRGGRYREGTRAELIGFLVRNKYV